VVKGLSIDTSALYALFAPADARHREAVAILRKLVMDRTPLITMEIVLIESYVLVHARTGRAKLLGFHTAVAPSTWLRRMEPSAEHEAKAWELLALRTDKDYSFVDAVSFVVMKALGLGHAFSFDLHFAQEGFELVGRTSSR
jgi:hypothetical protein